jgi:hypothetical protein
MSVIADDSMTDPHDSMIDLCGTMIESGTIDRRNKMIEWTDCDVMIDLQGKSKTIAAHDVQMREGTEMIGHRGGKRNHHRLGIIVRGAIDRTTEDGLEAGARIEVEMERTAAIGTGIATRKDARGIEQR